jgi:hypothetical protein
MATDPKTTTAAEAAAFEAEILTKFQALTSYAERKAFYEANPCLAKIYDAGNFSAPVPPAPPAPAA